MSGVSIQSQVIAAAVATLGAIGDGAQAFRSKMSSFSIAQLPARNVMPEDGETAYEYSGTADHTFRFNVRHTVAATDEVDAAADPYYVATCQALMADITLGGLVTKICEGKQKWEMERGEISCVALVVTFEVEFSTSRSDPSVKKF